MIRYMKYETLNACTLQKYSKLVCNFTLINCACVVSCYYNGKDDRCTYNFCCAYNVVGI